MSMRAFVLAVTGLALSVTACSTYGTSVVETTDAGESRVELSVTVEPHLRFPRLRALQVDPPPREDQPNRGVLGKQAAHPPDAARFEKIIGVEKT